MLARSILLSTVATIVNEAVEEQDVEVLALLDQSPGFYTAVIEILVQDLAWIKQPSASYVMTLSDVLDVDRIECSLRILERFSLVSKRPVTILAEQAALCPLLVQLITLCRGHAFKFTQNTGIKKSIRMGQRPTCTAEKCYAKRKRRILTLLL